LKLAGHGSHGVHVCHRCGWPFPKPHPSARRKRAHKKICGTLEGYKVVDSEETSLSALSDDDNVSDEEPETPSENSCYRIMFFPPIKLRKRMDLLLWMLDFIVGSLRLLKVKLN
jgi:hypothetical protein